MKKENFNQDNATAEQGLSFADKMYISLTDPIMPWLLMLVMCGVALLVSLLGLSIGTGPIVFALTIVSVVGIAGVIAEGVEQDKQDELEERANADTELETCVCGANAQKLYFGDIDLFAVRCGECGRQGEMQHTMDDAIKRFNVIASAEKYKQTHAKPVMAEGEGGVKE